LANAKEESIEKQSQRAAEKDEREAENAAAKAAMDLENHNTKKQYEQDAHQMAKQREWLKFVPAFIGLVTVIISSIATILQFKKTSGLIALG
jgi:type IV secretory pathway component VirB8